MIGYGNSGTTHDFYCFNAAGQVWNGSAFVNWADGSYASYRVTATEVGTTGRFTGTAPSGTVSYELRERGASLALSYVVWTDSLQLVDIQADLALIEAKTNLIGTGLATVNVPVADDGGLSYLVIGDDYLSANGRALEWTFDETTGITESGAASFGLENSEDATESAQLNGTLTDMGSGTFKATVEIQDTDLAALSPGYYDWSVSVIESGVKITIAQNLQHKTRVQLLEKFSS